MNNRFYMVLVTTSVFLVCNAIYTKEATFKKTHPYHFELYLSRSTDKSRKPIIGLTKKRDGKFGGFKRRGKGEDGDITIKKSTNGDVFVTAENLYNAAASTQASDNISLKAIDGIEIRISQELVSALRDKTVLSELYIITQEK
jgi:hypothetical protein